MAGQFQEQGGAATMDPSAFLRWGTSRLMTHLCRPGQLEKQREKFEKKRLIEGKPHVVEYFHQVDDGYSHLCAQVLQSLAERYDIELTCYLVSGPTGRNVAEPELLLKLSQYDAYHVAPEYGLEFPRAEGGITPELQALATTILANQHANDFIQRAAAIGKALWSGDAHALTQYAEQWGRAADNVVQERVRLGCERRAALKHYSGGMFYYGGEWYWGVDRLYHLEQRFADLQIDRHASQPKLVERPPVEAGPLRDNGSLTFEIFPSLRSPYTAISFDRAVQLARDTGVNLAIRPVLPMVMRGVPVTREKGMYIFLDTAREARAAGVRFGNFYDPIGDPVRQGYSLYPWACEQGKGVELLSAFLQCAFADGINLNRSRGLKRVVELAGLDWGEAQEVLGRPGWEEQLEENRLVMYRANLWGVPSFRLLDQSGSEVLALWGQDRLWLIAREIQRQLASRQQDA